MPVTDRRTTARLVRLLPVARVLALFAAVAPLSLVAPTSVTNGVDQVILGEGADQRLILSSRMLDCAWTGNTARCVAPLAGRPLVVEVGYSDPARLPYHAAGCTAEHDGRPVGCRAGLGEYGRAAATVWLNGDVGLTAAELSAARAHLPWWEGDGLGLALLALWLTLTVAAGTVTYLFGPRVRPLPTGRRLLLTLGTGALALVLFGATGLLLELEHTASPWWAYLLPFTLVPAVLLAGWQWQLAGGGSPRRPARWAHTALAVFATAGYSLATLFIALLQGGFVD